MKKLQFISKFHWSNEVRIITFISLAVIFGAIFTMGDLCHGAISVIVPLVVFAAALFSPRYLVLKDRFIECKTLFCKISIPIESIKSIEPISNEDIKFSLRLFGSGGLFGFIGIFSNGRLGRYYTFITNRKELICIKTTKRTYVFNCEDLETLISIIDVVKSTKKGECRKL